MLLLGIFLLNTFIPFFSLNSLIDWSSIVPSIISYWAENVSSVSFLRIIRIFRFLRILRLFKSFQELTSTTENSSSFEVRYSSNISINKVNIQLIKLGIMLSSVFFISAGLIVLIENLFPGSFNYENITFLMHFILSLLQGQR